MCVLASAVDIDLLTHREAVVAWLLPPFFFVVEGEDFVSLHPIRGGDWLPSWSPPRFVLYLTWSHENLYLCVDML